MNRFRYVTAALAALCLGGCVTEQVVWDKPGVTPVAFEHDKNQCVYEAKLGTPNSKMIGTTGINAVLTANVDEALRIRDLQGLCMQARGYQKRTVQAETDPMEVIPEIKQAKN